MSYGSNDAPPSNGAALFVEVPKYLNKPAQQTFARCQEKEQEQHYCEALTEKRATTRQDRRPDTHDVTTDIGCLLHCRDRLVCRSLLALRHRILQLLHALLHQLDRPPEKAQLIHKGGKRLRSFGNPGRSGN